MARYSGVDFLDSADNLLDPNIQVPELIVQVPTNEEVKIEEIQIPPPPPPPPVEHEHEKEEEEEDETESSSSSSESDDSSSDDEESDSELFGSTTEDPPKSVSTAVTAQVNEATTGITEQKTEPVAEAPTIATNKPETCDEPKPMEVDDDDDESSESTSTATDEDDLFLPKKEEKKESKSVPSTEKKLKSSIFDDSGDTDEDEGWSIFHFSLKYLLTISPVSRNNVD
jgi:hypothetical protein